MNIRLFFLVIVLAAFSSMRAFIVSIKAWKNDKTGQVIVGFGDWHIKNDFTMKHRDAVLNYSRSINGTIVVEDMYTISEIIEPLKGLFLEDKVQPESRCVSIPCMSECREFGLDARNVEFRYFVNLYNTLTRAYAKA